MEASGHLDGVETSRVLGAAMRAGARWAELFVEERDAETVRLDGGVVELGSDRDVGAAVRVISGVAMGLAYTNTRFRKYAQWSRLARTSGVTRALLDARLGLIQR